MKILRSITQDGKAGFNEHDQLVWVKEEKDFDARYYFMADVRGLVCEICRRGWDLATAEAFVDQLRWDLINSYVHHTCFVRHHALRDREVFFNALAGAKVRFGGLVPEANRYWPTVYRESAAPWYSAKLLDHPASFVIGARKRVIEVQVVPDEGTAFDWWKAASRLFDNEDVTKHFDEHKVLLHAWSEEKLREYVKVLVDIGRYAKKRLEE